MVTNKMKMNIGVIIISWAVCIYLVANYLDFSDLFAWLLAGIGVSKLGDYWNLETKSQEINNGNK